MSDPRDLVIRSEGRAGRITLNRPRLLNALSWPMCLDIEKAFQQWVLDDGIKVVLIDGAGDKAFCAGGDLREMYASGMQGDHGYGRRFLRDEYRLNAMLAAYPKPIVSFLHGFTMGGGVGIGCHVSHRIVCENSMIAMPEVSIGLVPDVGGSLLLANAPGRLGLYLGLTGARMGPADAILAGFADHFIPQDQWEAAVSALCATGDPRTVASRATDPSGGDLAPRRGEIDRLFASGELSEILSALRADEGEFAQTSLACIEKNAPLSMACAARMIAGLAGETDLKVALEREYRFTSRSMEHGDFLEGIRAAVIDRDKAPAWRYGLDDIPAGAVDRMLMPVGEEQSDQELAE